MVRRLVLVCLVVSTVATLLAAQQNTGAPVVPEPAIALPPPLPPVTAKDLLDGLKNPGRWLTYSGDYTGQRHSRLSQATYPQMKRVRSPPPPCTMRASPPPGEICTSVSASKAGRRTSLPRR